MSTPTLNGPTGGAATASEAADGAVLTPTARRVGRRALPWVIGVIVLVVVGLVIVIVRGAGAGGGTPLAADNPAPGGAMGVVEVLRQQGVDVVVSDTVAETESLVADSDAGDTTVLFFDDGQFLDSDQRQRLRDLDTDLVLVEPDTLELGDLATELSAAGRIDGQLDAECTLPAAGKAGSVTVDSGRSYRVASDSAGADAAATTCFGATDGDDDERFGVIQVADGDRTITALGLGEALSNGAIINDGNAALALNLLGENDTLIWYLATSDDLRESTPPSLAELTPGWVTPMVVLLFLVGVFAAIWRGRRMGPLVVENLPVVVRASETMEGRARLYERSDSRLHALDALRIGAVERLARAVGLSRTASVGEVVDATATLTGRDRASVAAILVDAVPTTDSELVHFSDLLLTLEDDTLRASRSH